MNKHVSLRIEACCQGRVGLNDSHVFIPLSIVFAAETVWSVPAYMRRCPPQSYSLPYLSSLLLWVSA